MLQEVTIMSATEQLWFAVGIAGFVIFLQGASNYIFSKLPRVNPHIGNVTTGLLIYIIAIIALFNI